MRRFPPADRFDTPSSLTVRKLAARVVVRNWIEQGATCDFCVATRTSRCRALTTERLRTRTCGTRRCCSYWKLTQTFYGTTVGSDRRARRRFRSRAGLLVTGMAVKLVSREPGALQLGVVPAGSDRSGVERVVVGFDQVKHEAGVQGSSPRMFQPMLLGMATGWRQDLFPVR